MWGKVYSHETITTIKIINIFITAHSFLQPLYHYCHCCCSGLKTFKVRSILASYFKYAINYS